MKIKGLIFDLDGVLVDTKKIHFDALNVALKSIKFEQISAKRTQRHSNLELNGKGRGRKNSLP